MTILFQRQPDGSYIQSGELPAGTRYVSVYINGTKCVSIKKTAEWLDVFKVGMALGQLKAQYYEVSPEAAPAKMSEETKNILKTVNAKKKIAKVKEKEDLEKEEAENKQSLKKLRRKSLKKT